jgi:hypothetical protein
MPTPGLPHALAISLLLGACAHPRENVTSPPPPKPVVAKPPPPPDDPDWVRHAAAFLGDQRPALRECYETELRRVESLAVGGAFRQGAPVPKLAGKLTLAIPIESDGSVIEPRIEEDTLQNENVRACLLAKASGLRLPPPPEGEPVELTLPFTFQLLGPGD